MLPQQPTMVVYAHNCCEASMQRACNSAMRWGFKACKPHGLKDLVSLAALNPEGYHILSNSTYGAGYWLWKPLLVWQTLLQAADGDVIVYMDSDSDIVADPTPLLDLLQHQDVVGFNSFATEANWTKTDAFLLLNASQYRDQKQLFAGLVILRRSWHSLGFVSQWLSYAQDTRLITNKRNTLLPSELQGQNHPGFMQHRNDQAIFSLLYKKWNFTTFPDPSRFGEGRKDRPYPTIWNLHMSKT